MGHILLILVNLMLSQERSVSIVATLRNARLQTRASTPARIERLLFLARRIDILQATTDLLSIECRAFFLWCGNYWGVKYDNISPVLRLGIHAFVPSFLRAVYTFVCPTQFTNWRNFIIQFFHLTLADGALVMAYGWSGQCR